MSFPGRFRVWDTKYRLWQDTDVFRVCGDGKLNNFHDEMIISWSTGLFDKNGVEIFEGDVCEHEYYGIGVIEYSQGAYWPNRVFWEGENQENYLECNIDFFGDKCKKLGNRFEHPELLNPEAQAPDQPEGKT